MKNWKLIKENPERVQTQMYVALQIAAALSTLCEPFLPHTAKKLQQLLGLPNAVAWSDVAKEAALIPAGSTLGQAELLFQKIEDETIQKQLDKL